MAEEKIPAPPADDEEFGAPEGEVPLPEEESAGAPEEEPVAVDMPEDEMPEDMEPEGLLLTADEAPALEGAAVGDEFIMTVSAVNEDGTFSVEIAK